MLTLNVGINKNQNTKLPTSNIQASKIQASKIQVSNTGEDYASSGNRICEDYHAQGKNYEGEFERGQRKWEIGLKMDSEHGKCL